MIKRINQILESRLIIWPLVAGFDLLFLSVMLRAAIFVREILPIGNAILVETSISLEALFVLGTIWIAGHLLFFTLWASLKAIGPSLGLFAVDCHFFAD